MDKELDDFFDGYDLSGEQDEQTYRRQSHTVVERFEGKLEKVGHKLRFAQDLLALFRYFLDERVAWQKKTIVVGALLYFISPLDTVPDVAPLIGYLDDLGVILAVTKFMSKELEPYYPSYATEELPVEG
ncbi:MAG: YkvA family protein [Bacteroidia bacterium]|nr:YkvA family protein [Bacteroidia bacterium]